MIVLCIVAYADCELPSPHMHLYHELGNVLDLTFHCSLNQVRNRIIGDSAGLCDIMLHIVTMCSVTMYNALCAACVNLWLRVAWVLIYYQYHFELSWLDSWKHSRSQNSTGSWGWDMYESKDGFFLSSHYSLCSFLCVPVPTEPNQHAWI